MTTHEVFVGVDVGGTKIGLNAIDGARRPVAPTWVQVPAQSHLGPQATVRQIIVGLEALLRDKQLDLRQVVGIGVDSPGPADNNGRLQRPANLHPDWNGFELRENAQATIAKFANREVPVVYENDCNAAALWESFRGCPEGDEVMFLLAPGTGLGGGIVINGQLLRGARGMSAELGHIEIVHEPFAPGVPTPACGCGQRFCAEAFTSMAALIRILPGVLAQPEYANHPLQQIEGDKATLWRKRAYAVRGLAAGGDALCLALFDWQAAALARLCRQVANALDPDRIVIGGGFIEGGQQLTNRVMGIVRDQFKLLAFPEHAEEVVIETASSGDQAGCLGAALSAWQAVNR